MQISLDRRSLVLATAAFVTAAGTGASAWAQSGDYPARPITLIVPFPAGGGTDAFARPLATQFSKLTGKALVIDNRGGAVGLALNLNPSWINFYLATDIVTAKHTPQFIPIKQSVMNVTLGIGVPIGRRSHRIAAYVYDKDRR